MLHRARGMQQITSAAVLAGKFPQRQVSARLLRPGEIAAPARRVLGGNLAQDTGPQRRIGGHGKVSAYSITSSTRASSATGTVIPSAQGSRMRSPW
jgi:hypothetical protein